VKTGVILSFYDFRADVRDLIKEIQSGGHQIVLFYRASEEQDILKYPIENLEYRKIDEELNGFRNSLLVYAFLLFKKLPASRHNYFLMELFKISNSSSEKARILNQLILFIQKLGLNFLSYDFLIRHLRYSAKTRIDDIDRFIGFTEFQSDYFAARLLREKRPLSVYVYSWDHPCKHTRFSKSFQYMVWSEGIKEDLVSLQGVPPENVSIIGSSQFTYIHAYLNRPDNDAENPTTPYVYYCCAIGILHLIPQEIAIIRQISNQLLRIRPDWKLLVRPYPVLNNWSVYEPLMKIQNVILDDGFRNSPFPDFISASFDKFKKLQHAQLVLHGGSTIGLEASFLNTPTLLVDFGYRRKKTGLSVYGFIHQYQNEKYLLEKGLGIISPAELEAVLDEPSEVLSKNKIAASGFFLKAMETIAVELLK
jgi:hypothetical protein